MSLPVFQKRIQTLSLLRSEAMLFGKIFDELQVGHGTSVLKEKCWGK
jgi:hypothetical protein